MPNATAKQIVIGIDFLEIFSNLPKLDSNKMPEIASIKTKNNIKIKYIYIAWYLSYYWVIYDLFIFYYYKLKYKIFSFIFFIFLIINDT